MIHRHDTYYPVRDFRADVMRKFTAHDKRIVSHVLIVLSVAAENNLSVSLEWAVTGSTGLHLIRYDVYRGVGHNATTFSLVGTATNPAYNDTGLEMYTDYSYRVIGKYSPDVSVMSNDVDATTTGTQYIYVLGNVDGLFKIATLDISDPNVPSLAATTSQGVSELNAAYSVMMDSRYIYTVLGHVGSSRRYIIDTNSPLTPAIINTAGPPDIYGGLCVRTGVSYANNVMFTNGLTGTKMRSWDISVPATPAMISDVAPGPAGNISTLFGYDSVRNRLYFLYAPVGSNNMGYYNVANNGTLTWGGFITIRGSWQLSSGGAIYDGKWFYNDMTENYMNGYETEPLTGTVVKSFVAYPDNAFHVNGILNPVVWKNRWHIHATHYANINATPIEIVDLTDVTQPITTRRHIGDFGSTCNWFTIVGNYLFWLRGSDSKVMVSDLADMDAITTTSGFSVSGVSPLAIVSYAPDMWTGNNGLCAS